MDTTLPTGMDAWADAALQDMLRRVFLELAPRPAMAIHEWAETFRTLSSEENPDYGGRPYSLENAPAARGVLAACSDRRVRRVVAQKSAQWTWTSGVVCNVLAYHVHWSPCVQVVMFPREKSAKDFDAEKFSPMVRATPVLAKRIKLKSRSDGNSATRKHYPGGLIKLVASNSPSDVKSTSAKVRIVEEPDDTNKDVRGQGNSITLLRERGKTIRDSFELIGGTPTAKDASEIEAEMRTTDQRRFLAPCHHCGESHEVEWAHVVIPGFSLRPEDLAAPDIDARYPSREVYGRARWEEAYYVCPHCGGLWSDDERIANIRQAAAVPPLYGWVPTANSADAGFYCNELQSVFDGSRVPVLAEKYLVAWDLLEQGDDTKMIAFQNSTRGMTWEFKGELPEEDSLRARAEPYAEWTCPAGGMVPLMAVDVQHDRLAVTVWVIGRGEEMWLAWWGELYGQTIVPHAGAWLELEQMLPRKVRHASGAELAILAVGVDCGDGNTSEASYAFVRKHQRAGRDVIALKGANDDQGKVEIWTPPKAIDPNNRATKASRHGVQIHIVGGARALDLILGTSKDAGRIRLEGSGPGRMHWYESVRPDFYEQILSEIKIPNRNNPRIKTWKKRTDRNNEALDCTKYVVYLCRHTKLHLRTKARWDVQEMMFRQGTLLGSDVPAEGPAQAEKVQTSAPEEVPAPAVSTYPAPPVADVDAMLAASRFKALMAGRQGGGRRGR